MSDTANTQTVTISFFRYGGLNKIWGMKQMYSARAPMKAMKGLQFYKPLGTGSGVGYSVWPDWGVYGMLAVWENEQCAMDYLESDLMRSFQNHSREVYTIFLKPISSRGTWTGFGDWQFSDPMPESSLVAALTRATLRPKFLFKFWQMVPGVSAEHDGYKGLIFTKGVGEIPLFEQATFSIWENVESMEEFAYKTFHGEAVKITRKYHGFREEMFTRLKPYRAVGSWKGADPLKVHFQAEPLKSTS